MGVRLRWTPRVEGDSQKIYRATAPFDKNSLPAALITLDATAGVYEDEATTEGVTYWYAVSVVEGARERLSTVVSAVAGATGGVVPVFDPSDLFASSEVGEYWPVDPAYFYTDTGATTLVSAVGDAVAAWKGAKYGLLATQATSGKRPLYARQPVGGWTQRILQSEALDNAAWTKTNCAVAGGYSDPYGGSTAWQITASATGAAYVAQTFNRTGKTSTWSIACEAGSVNRVWIGLRLNSGAYSDNIFDTVSGTWVATGGGVTRAQTDLGGGKWEISITVSDARNDILYFGPVDSGSTSPSATAGATIYVSRPQMEYNSARSTYQARAAVYSAPTSGADEAALYFDGSDDTLVTSAIDMTAASAATVATKLDRRVPQNDYEALVGFGADINATNGSFTVMLDTNNAGLDPIFPAMRGTSTFGRTTPSQTVPYNLRLITEFDLGADSFGVWIDGTSQTLTTAAGTASGGGTFGNLTLGIGRRTDNVTLPAAMTLTKGLVVIGRTLTTDERGDLDDFLAAA